MKKTKKFITEFDYQILLIFFILAIIGLVMQLDISQERALTMFFKQFLWALLSTVTIIFILLYIRIDFIRKTIKYWLGLSILLLAYVLIHPHVVNGANRGIKIGPINFQPSLLARIVLVIFTADQLDKKSDALKTMTLKEFLYEFRFLLLSIATVYLLVLAEKHLSILIILSLVILSMFWLAGLNFKTLSQFVGIVLLIAILGFTLKSKFSDTSGTAYRGRRIKIYTKYSLITRALGIEAKKIPHDESLQIKESLIALSMGKLFGLGPGKSVAKNYYLAESRTDYIFGIIGEEYGFIGALGIMLLYAWLFFRITKLYNKLEGNFLKFVILGLGLNLVYNAAVNIGVNISALPSTGVTLPFISYGGTSFLINSLALGIILSISSQWNER